MTKVIDLAIAVVNAPLTAITALINRATGATVRLDRHLMVVCEGGLLSNLGLSSAFATGNTVNVKSSQVESFRNSPTVLEHEWKHSRQWALFGVWFLPLYVVNYALSQLLSGGQCWNVFEWEAGFEDGHYPCSRLGSITSEAP